MCFQFNRGPLLRRNRAHSFVTECGCVRCVENVQNCPFEPRQLADERPTLGKGMVAKKAIQISTRIEYRGLSRGARQQVVPYEGRKVVSSPRQRTLLGTP